MTQKDTLYITDSTCCKYIVIDRISSQSDTIFPIEKLWKTTTYAGSLPPQSYENHNNSNGSSDAVSAIVLAFFVILIIFSREVINVIPASLSSLFKLKNHFKIEETLLLSAQRDIVAIIASIYFPVLIILMNREMITDNFSFSPPILILILISFFLIFWFFRKSVFSILTWVTKDKTTFKLVEKISYNHLIISVIFSFPAIFLRFIWPETPEITIINTLLFCILFIYTFYLIRGYQIILSHHYSHFFYILYLCTVELLPVALLANLILSY